MYILNVDNLKYEFHIDFNIPYYVNVIFVSILYITI